MAEQSFTALTHKTKFMFHILSLSRNNLTFSSFNDIFCLRSRPIDPNVVRPSVRPLVLQVLKAKSGVITLTN